MGTKSLAKDWVYLTLHTSRSCHFFDKLNKTKEKRKKLRKISCAHFQNRETGELWDVNWNIQGECDPTSCHARAIPQWFSQQFVGEFCAFLKTTTTNNKLTPFCCVATLLQTTEITSNGGQMLRIWVLNIKDVISWPIRMHTIVKCAWWMYLMQRSVKCVFFYTKNIEIRLLSMK